MAESRAEDMFKGRPAQTDQVRPAMAMMAAQRKPARPMTRGSNAR